MLTSDQRFAILMLMFPVCVSILAWVFSRMMARYDSALHEREKMRNDLDIERQERVDRHTARNHDALTTLNATLVRNTKELSDRLVFSQEKMAEALSGVSSRLARIEGRQEHWDGRDRRNDTINRGDVHD